MDGDTAGAVKFGTGTCDTNGLTDGPTGCGGTGAGYDTTAPGAGICVDDGTAGPGGRADVTDVFPAPDTPLLTNRSGL